MNSLRGESRPGVMLTPPKLPVSCLSKEGVLYRLFMSQQGIAVRLAHA